VAVFCRYPEKNSIRPRVTTCILAQFCGVVVHTHWHSQDSGIPFWPLPSTTQGCRIMLHTHACGAGAARAGNPGSHTAGELWPWVQPTLSTPAATKHTPTAYMQTLLHTMPGRHAANTNGCMNALTEDTHHATPGMRQRMRGDTEPPGPMTQTHPCVGTQENALSTIYRCFHLFAPQPPLQPATPCAYIHARMRALHQSAVLEADRMQLSLPNVTSTLACHRARAPSHSVAPSLQGCQQGSRQWA
jgi:hypothetical protein